MDTSDIMVCIEMLTDMLPELRDCLGMTQREFAGIIGISRQSVIDLEHKNRKITRSILIAMITFFTLRCESALLLYRKGFYSTNFVTSLGFTTTLIEKIYDLGEGCKWKRKNFTFNGTL